MSTPDNDNVLEQLLEAIENNPEFKETLRRHFLADELLKLPENFAQFAHVALDFNKLMAERLQSTVEGMTSMADTIGSIAGQLERLTGVFAAVSVTLNNVEAEYRGIHGALRLLARDAYARQAARHALRLARANLSIAGPRIVSLYTADSGDFVFDLAADAEAQGRITAEQGKDLEQSDLVIAGSDGRGEVVYALAEIAITAHKDDVINARRRAAALRQASGIRAIPAVIAAAITDEARAEAADEVVFLQVMPKGIAAAG